MQEKKEERKKSLSVNRLCYQHVAITDKNIAHCSFFICFAFNVRRHIKTSIRKFLHNNP